MRDLELGLSIGVSARGSAVTPPVIPENAVSSNNGLNSYILTDNLFNKAPLTVGARVKRENNTGGYAGFAALNKIGDELFYCGTKVDGSMLDMYFGGTGDSGSGPILVEDEWAWVVQTFDGSEAKLYFDGALAVTAAMTQGADLPVSFTLFTTNFGSRFAGALQGVFVDESVWTLEQVVANLNKITPLSPVSAWWLLDGVDDVMDRSGNGRHLTKVGTPVAVAGPGIPL